MCLDGTGDSSFFCVELRQIFYTIVLIDKRKMETPHQQKTHFFL